MKDARSYGLLLLMAGLPAISSGCVPQEKYDQLLTTNRSLTEQIVMLQDERDTVQANMETVRNQLTRAGTDLNSIQTDNSRLTQQLGEIGDEYDHLLTRVSKLEIGPLPPDVESALVQLSTAYPNLLTFDREQGMIRFSSDFTFDLGSAVLSTQAVESITELAKILNSETAQGFEVRVVGHTDNVPIGKPDTRAKHPTNLHLSVHRSIAVQKALTTGGVDRLRVMVAGYGESRPMVPNTTRGAAENRRVEIFFVPMTRQPEWRKAEAESPDSNTKTTNVDLDFPQK